MFKRLLFLLLLPMLAGATMSATDSLHPDVVSSSLIKDGATVFFRPFYGSPVGSSDSECQSSEMFLNGSSTAGSSMQAVTGDHNNPSVPMYWTLKEVETASDGTPIYTLKNPKYNLYLSSTADNCTMVEEASAGRYKIIPGTSTTFSKTTECEDTYDMTYYVYFLDADTNNGIGINASTRRGSGPFSPEIVSNSSIADNGNAYYTVLAPTVDISEATEPDANYMADMLIYIKPCANGKPFLSVRVTGFDSETSTCKYSAYATAESYLEASMWKLILSETAEDGTRYYKIYNPATDRYVNSSTSNSALVTEEDAGLFKLGVTNGHTTFTFKDTSTYLNINGSSGVLSSYTYADTNSQFVLTTVGANSASDAIMTPTADKATFIVKNSDRSAELTINANKSSSNVVRYLEFVSGNNKLGTDSVAGLNAAWKFIPSAVADAYYIYNVQREVYLGKTSESVAFATVDLAPNEYKAGLYKLVDATGTGDHFALKDTENSKYGYLTVSGNSLKNVPIISDWFALAEPHDMALKYLNPGQDIIFCPTTMGYDGYANLYSDFQTVILETTDNLWKGVWTLQGDNRYPRKNDGKNNYWLINEDGITTTTNDDNTTSTTYNYVTQAQYKDIVYNLYNRVEQYYITADADGNIGITKDQTQAAEIKFSINEADSNNSVSMQIYRPTKVGDGDDATYENADISQPSTLYLTYDGNNLKVGAQGTNSSFYLRDAVNTSFDAIYDGAQIELYPYRMQTYNKKIYVSPPNNKCYRESASDTTNRGGYTVFTLIKCKNTDNFSPRVTTSSASAPRRDASTSGTNDVDLTDTYYLYNELSKMYLGQVWEKGHNAWDNGWYIPLTSNKSEAGRYKFSPDAYQLDAIVAYDIDTNNPGKYINCSVTSTGGTFDLVNYPLNEDNRLFFVDNVKTITPTVLDKFADGVLIQLTPWQYLGDKTLGVYNEAGGKVYLNQTTTTDSNGQKVTTNKVTCGKTETLSNNSVSEALYTWKLVAAKDAEGNVIEDVYYFVNVATGEYMSSTGYAKLSNNGVMTTIAPTADGGIPEGAGRFQVIPDTESGLYVAFKDYDSYDETTGKSRFLNNVLTDGSEVLGWQTLADNTNMSQYSTTTADITYTDPISGETSTINAVTKKTYNFSQDWYYINPVTFTTSMDKDVIDWVLQNIDPDHGRVVGFFDGLENTLFPGENTSTGTNYRGIIVNRILESSVYNEETGLYDNTYRYEKTDQTSDNLTLEQLVSLVQYYYTENQNRTLEAGEVAAANEAYQKLIECISKEEYIIHPRIGRFYTITSAFPYFKDMKLRETYYMEHHDKTQGTQKVHFHSSDWDTEVVSSFWRFDVQENKYTDDTKTKTVYDDQDAHHYFFMRAVNSRNVMRKTSPDVTADVRSADDYMNVGLFALRKDYSLNVYPGSVLLRSYTNNSTRSFQETGSFLGIWTDQESTNPNDGIVREGSDSRVTPTTGRPEKNANNWYIREIKTVPVQFAPENGYGSGEEGKAHDCDKHDERYYNTFCFPFNVKLPTATEVESETLRAYIGVKPTENGNNVILTELTSESDGAYEDTDGRLVIKAFHPFILTAKCDTSRLEIVYGPGEEYGLPEKRGMYTDDNWAQILKDYELPATTTSTDNNTSTAVRRKDITGDTTTTSTTETDTDWSMTSIDHILPNGNEENKSNTEISALRWSSSGMVGSITPIAVSGTDDYYALHDDNDDTVSKIEAQDYMTAAASDDNSSTLTWSFDSSDLHEDYGVPNGSLPGSTSTYVLSANKAVLVGLTDNLDINDETPITSGVEEVTTEIVNEPGRDANGNLIYFDLYGRRVMNPAPGIYILTNGQKVVVR
jgi:hypothetical protein